jgi:hypothetical protein
VMPAAKTGVKDQRYPNVIYACYRWDVKRLKRGFNSWQMQSHTAVIFT